MSRERKDQEASPGTCPGRGKEHCLHGDGPSFNAIERTFTETLVWARCQGRQMSHCAGPWGTSSVSGEKDMHTNMSHK